LMLGEERRAFQRTGFADGVADQATGPPLPVDDSGPLGEVALRRRTLTRFDVQQEPALRGLPFLQCINSLLVTPIAVGGETRGLLYVGTEAPAWLDGDEAFLELVATRISLRIEGAGLRAREREIEHQKAQME